MAGKTESPAPNVICPSCGTEIAISEALTRQLAADAERRLREREADLERAFAAKVKLAAEQERAATAQRFEVQVRDLTAQLAEAATAQAAARARELDLLKARREVEQAKAEVELVVARKLEVERQAIESAAATRAGEDAERRVREKEQQLETLRRQLDEAQRKAAQGSQQTQGEAGEVALEEALRGTFPLDEIEPVPKGMRGADVIQRVRNGTGRACGTILWEAKQTKAWSEKWLGKLRDDQRELRAEIAVLVSDVLPEGVQTCGCVAGVWVSHPRAALGLAAALRAGLVQVAAAKAAEDGKAEKAQALYAYLTGAAFRQRVEAVVEAFSVMRADLEKEKRALQATWAKREQQLARALTGAAGLWGDMQGIVGPALAPLAALELPAPEPPGA